MYNSYYYSPIGIIKIEANDIVLTKVELLYKQEELKEKTNEITLECKKQLEEYFVGTRKKFNLKYAFSGTEFQCAVWRELSNIEYGSTVSYQEIAKRINRKRAVRAVANAIGKNPLLIVLPCHRVIGSNGKLIGFSASTEKKDGLIIKRELLELEGINIFKN